MQHNPGEKEKGPKQYCLDPCGRFGSSFETVSDASLHSFFPCRVDSDPTASSANSAPKPDSVASDTVLIYLSLMKILRTFKQDTFKILLIPKAGVRLSADR
jgi:hypothetical protein